MGGTSCCCHGNYTPEEFWKLGHLMFIRPSPLPYWWHPLDPTPTSHTLFWVAAPHHSMLFWESYQSQDLSPDHRIDVRTQLGSQNLFLGRPNSELRQTERVNIWQHDMDEIPDALLRSRQASTWPQMCSCSFEAIATPVSITQKISTF